jgi:hypothetical protein
MRSVLLILCLWATIFAHAQSEKKESFRFQKIDAEMLSKKQYAIDSNASAIVLGDVGYTAIEGNAKGWFSFVFKRHKRIHILSKNGYDEATFQIPLYHNGFESEEKLESVKAYAYNLENGQVTETKLSKDNIFTEKKTTRLDIKKFTLPSVREGTIIDVEYKISSDYLYTLQPWNFQSTAPTLWSEYTLGVPQFFEYMFIYKGYVPFYINENKERMEQYTIIDRSGTGPTETHNLRSAVTEYHWVTKEAPAFKREAYLSTPSNFLSRMEFQLAAHKQPLTYKNLVPSWPQMTHDLLKDEDFGLKLDRNNGWLSDVMKDLRKGSEEQQARNVFAWVRDNITCNGQEGIYLTTQVKDVFREAKGSVAEVNLLLVTMLRYAGLKADPVMLSTRENGTIFTPYPMLSRFNYIIASVSINGQNMLLDASKPQLGFGRLLPEVHNGMARMINEAATELSLLTDSLRERKMSMVFLNTEGGNWQGSFQQVQGYYESYRTRKTLQEKGEASYFEGVREGLSSSMELTNGKIDSTRLFDMPLGLRADIKLKTGGEDLLFINPMFGEGWKENPFKSPDRSYPVEMPYTIDESFNLTMYVPAGYVVDELPKSLRVALNEQKEGSFDYLISQSEGVISMKSQIRLQRANYTQQEYEELREFFNMIVAKHKEQIVLKKIK